ncbi:MAG: hypothetical protein GF320_00115, partial [Armatimonadia bacterium]|nr:hypothetical protein [Armatimonadia bacterium]
GKRSLAVSLEFRVPERTLTSEEADEAFDKAVAALAKELGAELRS